MSQAVFWVKPMARWTSQDETPFLQFTTCHIAMSHFASGSGESSKMVPVLAVNCRLSWRALHCQRSYFSRKVTLLDPQRGHSTPSAQRRATRYSRQLAGTEKYWIAC